MMTVNGSTTGDLNNNYNKVISLLKKTTTISLCEVDQAGLATGNPAAYLPILHSLLTNNCRLLARHLIQKGHKLVLTNDRRFFDSLLKVLRDEFSYWPTLSSDQFFSPGFAERKLILLSDVLHLCHLKSTDLQRASLSHTHNHSSSTQRRHRLSSIGGSSVCSSGSRREPVRVFNTGCSPSPCTKKQTSFRAANKALDYWINFSSDVSDVEDFTCDSDNEFCTEEEEIRKTPCGRSSVSSGSFKRPSGVVVPKGKPDMKIQLDRMFDLTNKVEGLEKQIRKLSSVLPERILELEKRFTETIMTQNERILKLELAMVEQQLKRNNHNITGSNFNVQEMRQQAAEAPKLGESIKEFDLEQNKENVNPGLFELKTPSQQRKENVDSDKQGKELREPTEVFLQSLKHNFEMTEQYLSSLR